MTHPHWRDAHERAVAAGEESYRDPVSGYTAFTSLGLLARGSCCGAGCRHCPYGHLAVRPGRPPRAHAPTWRVRLPDTEPESCDVLFWSTGKDSFLTLLRLREAGTRRVVLLTTHDSRTGNIAHQEVRIEGAVQQAEALGVDLLTVPLTPEIPYEEALRGALAVISRRLTVARLVFGDLHLQDIRGWREDALGPWCQEHGAALHFPLWHADYDALLARLEASGAAVTLSAVPGGVGVVGQRYDAAFARSLPEGIDRFGENGEFHTFVDPVPSRSV